MHEFNIALTGHRPPKLDDYDLHTPFYRRLQAKLESFIDSVADADTVVVCHSGMALGADTVWAHAILAQLEKHPERVRFIAHVPVMTQPDQWPKASADHWRGLVAQADDVLVYADAYSPRVMQERNIGMVDAADALVAVWDGTRGGTGNAVRYAKETATPIIRITPDELR